MACLSGQESRRWTVGELVERLKNLGLSVSRATVTAALADLEVELALSAWSPLRLLERGSEWILTSKSEFLELLEEDKEDCLLENLRFRRSTRLVLLVVLGAGAKAVYQRPGLRKSSKLDASS